MTILETYYVVYYTVINHYQLKIFFSYWQWENQVLEYYVHIILLFLKYTIFTYMDTYVFNKCLLTCQASFCGSYTLVVERDKQVK